jgi:hypothetical protein
MTERIALAESIDSELFKYYNESLGYNEHETADILIGMRGTECI